MENKILELMELNYVLFLPEYLGPLSAILGRSSTDHSSYLLLKVKRFSGALKEVQMTNPLKIKLSNEPVSLL